jgi:hypothetical protein
VFATHKINFGIAPLTKHILYNLARIIINGFDFNPLKKVPNSAPSFEIETQQLNAEPCW